MSGYTSRLEESIARAKAAHGPKSVSIGTAVEVDRPDPTDSELDALIAEDQVRLTPWVREEPSEEDVRDATRRGSRILSVRTCLARHVETGRRGWLWHYEYRRLASDGEVRS